MENGIEVSKEDIDSEEINATLQRHYENILTEGAAVAEDTNEKLQQCIKEAEKRSEDSGLGSFIDNTVSDVLSGDVSVSKFIDESG